MCVLPSIDTTPTVIQYPVISQYPKAEIYDIEEKMAMIVNANAVVHPRAMTVACQSQLAVPSPKPIETKRNSLVMTSNAAMAASAVLAPDRRPNHARNAKIGLIKLPQRKQLVNDSLLLSDAVESWHKAGVGTHCGDVIKHHESVQDCKHEIEQIRWVRRAAAGSTWEHYK